MERLLLTASVLIPVAVALLAMVGIVRMCDGDRGAVDQRRRCTTLGTGSCLDTAEEV